jgi:hypothetical protein
MDINQTVGIILLFISGLFFCIAWIVYDIMKKLEKINKNVDKIMNDLNIESDEI